MEAEELPERGDGASQSSHGEAEHGYEPPLPLNRNTSAPLAANPRPRPILTYQRSDSWDAHNAKEHRQNSAYSGELSQQRQMFVSVRNQAGNRELVETSVPSKQELEKIPSHSLPRQDSVLTGERRMERFRSELMMFLEGGPRARGQATAALLHTGVESIERAMNFIERNPNSMWHRFTPPSGTDAIDDLRKSHGMLESESAFLRMRTQLLQGQVDIQTGPTCVVCGLGGSHHLLDEHGQIPTERGTAIPRSPSINSIGGRLLGIRTAPDHLEDRRPDPPVILTYQQMVERGMFEDEPSDDQKIDGDASALQGPGGDNYCVICMTRKNDDAFHKSECGHSYCHECLERHYKVLTGDAKVLRVKCIDQECNREIPEEEFKSFIKDDETLAKFKKFKNHKLVMLNNNLRFCCAPRCEGVLRGGPFTKKVQCPDCNQEACFKCGQAWHGYFTSCESAVNAGLSSWAFSKDVQKCPKCKAPIEKLEGCNHMTCASCRYEFCWICKGKYSHNHYDAWNICGCPGGQYTSKFVRCPACFSHCPCVSRVLITICIITVLFPLGVTALTVGCSFTCVVWILCCIPYYFVADREILNPFDIVKCICFCFN